MELKKIPNVVYIVRIFFNFLNLNKTKFENLNLKDEISFAYDKLSVGIAVGIMTALISLFLSLIFLLCFLRTNEKVSKTFISLFGNYFLN